MGRRGGFLDIQTRIEAKSKAKTVVVPFENQAFFFNPKGLSDTSRWLARSAYHRNNV